MVQPFAREQVETGGRYGPALQVAQFSAAEIPAVGDIETVAARARAMFIRPPG